MSLRPPPPPLEVYQEHVHDMLSPAVGDAFDFAVRLRCEWRATGHEISEEPLLRQIEEWHRRLVPEIENEVRSITRRWGMHQCAEAEQALTAHLGNRWPRQDAAPESPVPHCTVRAQVSRDSLLRDLERHNWLLDQHSRSGQRTVQREVELLGERLKLWQEVLEQVEAAKPSAVHLALRPADQEAVLIPPTRPFITDSPNGHEAHERSLERERELFRLAFSALDVHRQNGTEEAVFRGEYAISVLLDYLGITEGAPMPPPEEGNIVHSEADFYDEDGNSSK